MDPLTNDQITFAWQQMARWFRIQADHDGANRRQMKSIIGYSTPEEAAVRLCQQLANDVDHSALLRRLLAGKEPLPEPPPLRHSYPVYPD